MGSFTCRVLLCLFSMARQNIGMKAADPSADAAEWVDGPWQLLIFALRTMFSVRCFLSCAPSIDGFYAGSSQVARVGVLVVEKPLGTITCSQCPGATGDCDSKTVQQI